MPHVGKLVPHGGIAGILPHARSVSLLTLTWDHAVMGALPYTHELIKRLLQRLRGCSQPWRRAAECRGTPPRRVCSGPCWRAAQAASRARATGWPDLASCAPADAAGAAMRQQLGCRVWQGGRRPGLPHIATGGWRQMHTCGVAGRGPSRAGRSHVGALCHEVIHSAPWCTAGRSAHRLVGWASRLVRPAPCGVWEGGCSGVRAGPAAAPASNAAWCAPFGCCRQALSRLGPLSLDSLRYQLPAVREPLARALHPSPPPLSQGHAVTGVCSSPGHDRGLGAASRAPPHLLVDAEPRV